jgi:LysM repeat protein
VTTIVQINGIVNPNLIRVGQVLQVPAVAQPSTPTPTPAPATQQRTHVVQAGQNLFRIALRYGVSLEQLARVNGITNMNRIFVGQVLTIP